MTPTHPGPTLLPAYLALKIALWGPRWVLTCPGATISSHPPPQPSTPLLPALPTCSTTQITQPPVQTGQLVPPLRLAQEATLASAHPSTLEAQHEGRPIPTVLLPAPKADVICKYLPSSGFWMHHSSYKSFLVWFCCSNSMGSKEPLNSSSCFDLPLVGWAPAVSYYAWRTCSSAYFRRATSTH